jgi:hypothetical protein
MFIAYLANQGTLAISPCLANGSGRYYQRLCTRRFSMGFASLALDSVTGQPRLAASIIIGFGSLSAYIDTGGESAQSAKCGCRTCSESERLARVPRSACRMRLARRGSGRRSRRASGQARRGKMGCLPDQRRQQVVDPPRIKPLTTL